MAEDVEYTPPQGAYSTLPDAGGYPQTSRPDRNIHLADHLVDTDRDKVKELSNISRMSVKPLAKNDIRSMFIHNIGLRQPIDLRKEYGLACLLYNRSIKGEWADRVTMLARNEQRSEDVQSIGDDPD